MPDTVVPTKKLAVLARQVRNLVTAREGKDTLLGLGGILWSHPILMRLIYSKTLSKGIGITHFIMFVGVICPNMPLLVSIAT